MSVVSSSVWPSADAVATCRVAITELPPGLFSTSTGTPRSGESFSASERATTTVPPPGANGTTMRTVWLGNSAALAMVATTSTAAATTSLDNLMFIAYLLFTQWPQNQASAAHRKP